MTGRTAAEDRTPLFLVRREVGTSAAAERSYNSIIARHGYQVQNIGDGALEAPADSVVWVMGNANWYPRLFRQLVATPAIDRPLVVIWHFEPLLPPRASGLRMPLLSWREIAKIVFRDPRATDPYSNTLRLRALVRRGLPDLLACTSKGRCEALQDRGIAAEWVPLGSDPEEAPDLQLERDVGILFLGDRRVPRRGRLLRELRRRGLKVEAKGGWGDGGIWGSRRGQLLQRTKIMLNLQRYPGDLSGSRLTLAMIHKVLIVSEPMYRPAPFEPGLHYVSSRPDEMADAIRYYLEHDDERDQIVAAAYQLVTEEWTRERAISRILALIEKKRGVR